MNKTKIFFCSLYVSATTVGGGFVIISVIRKIFVEKLKFMSEDEMLEMTSLSQSSPGAVAVNMSIILGYKLCGISGAAIAVIGTLIPPMLIMSVIAAVYAMLGNFRDIAIISKIMTGVQAGVSAVVLDAALNMTSHLIKSKNIMRYLIFCAAFILQIFFSVSSVYIIFGAILIGTILYFIDRRGKNAVS
ncbi:MAG: chromate transporter [Eubacteriales bacterium]